MIKARESFEGEKEAMKKKKFKPVISRLKLYPEQAVLACCILTRTDFKVYKPEATICNNFGYGCGGGTWSATYS